MYRQGGGNYEYMTVIRYKELAPRAKGVEGGTKKEAGAVHRRPSESGGETTLRRAKRKID